MRQSPRRLILHIGQTKAGSTSIQNYLESQYFRLLENGFLFPRAGLKRGNPFDAERTSGHLSLLRDLCAGRTEAFESELETYSRSAVVLSAENVLVDRTDDMLRKIGAYFEDWQIDLAVVLRPQCDWVRSRYVESVLSGYHSRTNDFDGFVDTMFSAGHLDYAAALDRARSLLGARHVRAIAMNDPDTSLVVRFLDAVGVPVTDPDAAGTIHSNRREKSPAFIEAKRRLNVLTRDLPRQTALEIEHRLRKTAVVTSVDAQEFASAFPIRLSSTQIAHLRDGNDRLAASGYLAPDAPPLELGDPGPNDAVLPAEAAVTDTLLCGIRIAAGLAARQDAEPPDLLDLSDAQIDVLWAAFATCPVSLHVGTPSMAIWAALGAGRLVILTLPPGRDVYTDAVAYDGLDTASPIVALPMDGEAVHEILPRVPDLISFGADSDQSVVFALLDAMVPKVSFLYDVSPDLLQDFDTAGYRPSVLGRLTILSHVDRQPETPYIPAV